MKVSRRVVVGTLGGVAASLAATVGAVSLTRIAGGYLGFPPGLEWTLTGAVDIAGIAGGIMWTAFGGRVRKIGRPMNIVCTLVSGVGVGLDHATHAVEGPVWPWVAFAAGLFIPALAAWILHSLAVIADVVGVPGVAGDRQGDGQPGDDHPGDDQASHRQGGDAQVANRQTVIAKAGDRQETTIVTTRPTPGDQPALPSGHQAGDRQVPDRQAGRSPAPAASRPGRSLAAVPEPRLPWMTDRLINAVVTARRADSSYGRSAVVADHGLSPAKARALIEYINRHGLMRETA